MAKSQGNVFKRAKSERRKHPRKFKTWAEYVAYAAKKVKAPTRKKRKVTGKKKTARKKVTRKKSARKRAPKKKTTVVVKSVTRTVGSKKRRRVKRSPAKKQSRRRSVSGKGHNGLLIAAAVAVGGYFLIKSMSKPATTTPYTGQYGTLNTTVNPTRNTQSQDIINYAVAAGLAADTIANLIDRFNNSSDDEIKQVYDYVNTTGDIQYYA